MKHAIRTAALLLVALSTLAGCTVEGSETTTDTTQPETVDLMHDRGVLARAMRDIEKTIGASPAQLTGVDVYGEYVIVEAQDPRDPDHIDRYTWRNGVVEPREPVHLSGPQEDTVAKLYPSTAIQWGEVTDYVRAAERRVLRAKPIRIEHPRASYVDVGRSPYPEADGRVELRISIDGPRRSGYVYLTSSGDITTVEVS